MHNRAYALKMKSIKQTIQKLGIKDEVEKGRDILDIWFDSGVSWFCVSEEEVQSDVYLEGLDQYGGWFMSSLLTSTALQSRPPFKSVCPCCCVSILFYSVFFLFCLSIFL